MAEYITSAQVQSYGSFQGVAGEDIIDLVIPASKLAIDNYCGRTFEAGSTSARTFTKTGIAVDAVVGKILHLDQDLAEAAASITDSPTVVYLPENETPYHAIVITDGSWADPVIVTGYWAYSRTAPGDIIIASLQLAKWMYDMRESNEGTRVIVTPEGQVLLPSGLPPFIKVLLDPYRRIRTA